MSFYSLNIVNKSFWIYFAVGRQMHIYNEEMCHPSFCLKTNISYQNSQGISMKSMIFHVITKKDYIPKRKYRGKYNTKIIILVLMSYISCYSYIVWKIMNSTTFFFSAFMNSFMYVFSIYLKGRQKHIIPIHWFDAQITAVTGVRPRQIQNSGT